MTLTGKSILVTGGAGFIGSHLVDRLAREHPSKLVVVDNFFLGREENLRTARSSWPDLKILRLDAANLPAMRDVVVAEGVQVVFNLAVVPLPTSLNYPEWTIRSNVDIAVAFCELARWRCIETLVHCSSSEAYGSAIFSTMDEAPPLAPTTPYAASKAAGDQIVLSYCSTFGIDAVIVRPFNNFGPRQNPGSYAGIIPIVVQKVHSGSPVEIHGDGLQTRDYVFVRSTAEAMVKIYESEKARGRVINVATGHEITINDLVSRLLGALGAQGHQVIHGAARPGDVRRHRGAPSLLRNLTGYAPEPILDEDLRETVAWYGGA
jgi:UDP-glucose 4-epimerase